MQIAKVTIADKVALVRDKYGGNPDANLSGDEERLLKGEPLAYVIGWVPFLGFHIRLESHPLIPRPETEWWTEQLIMHLKQKFQDRAFTLVDLCAGSGAIGIAILKVFPNAHVTFGEIRPEHVSQIEHNLLLNELTPDRATVFPSDIFKDFPKGLTFDVIATNPPYIPADRKLDESVVNFEPHDALFAGSDGLKFIKEIWKEAAESLSTDGEVWMECDISNIEKSKKYAEAAGFRAEIRPDQYDQPRIVVASKTLS